MRLTEELRDGECRGGYRSACDIGDGKGSRKSTGTAESHLIGGTGIPANR